MEKHVSMSSGYFYTFVFISSNKIMLLLQFLGLRVPDFQNYFCAHLVSHIDNFCYVFTSNIISCNENSKINLHLER